MTAGTTAALRDFRGDFPAANFSARRIASALEAPGCHRRTVLDAASVDVDRLGVLTGSPPDRQSPIAISRGKQFERQVTDNGMAAALSLVRTHLGLEIPEARTVDLSPGALKEAYPDAQGRTMNQLRARLTRQHIENMITSPDQAPNLIQHAMTTLPFGGETAYLEQDVLAFAVAGRIHVVEIKSFPAVDGRADPSKASETVRQTAVYLLSMQDLVVELGAPPDIVDTTVLVILPHNLSFRPIGLTVDAAMQVRRLRRQLAAVPAAAAVLDGLPDGVSLPALPAKNATPEARAEARSTAGTALAALPARFCDGCVSCPLFRFCRTEADSQQLASRLGSEVAGGCGEVTTIGAALDLASGRRRPESPAEAAVADLLARGAAAARLATGARTA